jgi:uncharacterized protein (TIGR00369 family)
MELVYKICPEKLWREAERTGEFTGAPVDLQDGFIHFSTAEQVAETAAKHFAGQPDLLLVAVDASALGNALRYEPSRGGQLFPHLYGRLPLAAVMSVDPMPLGPDGHHLLPVPAGSGFLPVAAGWTTRPETGFMGLIGPVWTKSEGEERLFAFLAEARHLNHGGVVHGGMLMAFADQVLGIAAMRADPGRRKVTVQLDTHFLSTAQDGEFVEARCRVVRQTRSLLFMSGTLSVGTRAVATSSGVWKVLGA